MRYVQSTSCLMFAQRWSSQAPEAWRSGRWIHRVHHRFNGSLPLPRPHAGMCARRRSNFLLRRQEKVTKEKATPLSVSPSLRYGATCGARFRRGPRKLAALRFAQTARGPDPPEAVLLGTDRGEGEPGSLSGHRCARPWRRDERGAGGRTGFREAQPLGAQ